MLGYRGHNDWRDMSEFVVHFTSATGDGKTALGNLKSIVRHRKVEARNDFGAAKGLVMPEQTQKSACFSEIPLDLLDRLVKRRSSYGVGFRKDFLVRAGGAPVWYLEESSTIAKAVRELRVAVRDAKDWGSPFWTLTPFIDEQWGGKSETKHRFEWEREWRVPGELGFGLDDVMFVFVPKQEHEDWNCFWENVTGGTGGSGLLFVDPLWDENRLQDAFREVRCSGV